MNLLTIGRVSAGLLLCVCYLLSRSNSAIAATSEGGILISCMSRGQTLSWSAENPDKLVLLEPHNRGVKAITSGASDDVLPVLSPSKKYVLFTRTSVQNSCELCCLDLADSQILKEFVIGPIDKGSEVENVNWSPDGRSISFISIHMDNWNFKLVVMNLANRRISKFDNITDYSWSPDSRCLFLRHRGGRCSIYSVRSGVSHQFRLSFRDIYWIDGNNLIGESGDSYWKLVVADSTGRLVKRIDVDTENLGELQDYSPFFDDYLTFHKLPHFASNYIFDAAHKMSDGWHHSCYMLDIRSGRIVRLGPYAFVGFSPDGRDYLVSQNDRFFDAGHGNRFWFGSLWKLSLKTSRKTLVRGNICDIQGACW